MRLNNRGFSLVELIVVVAIFGIASTVILDLYINIQRSTVTSEEVVEVQQGMRLALEQMARDIQMAGVLVPIEAPITVATSNSISMETSTAFGAIARVSTATLFPANSDENDSLSITVSPGMANLFRSGAVRIIDPMSGCQLSVPAATCAARDGTAPYFTIPTPTANSGILTLTPSEGLGTEEIPIPVGSMIVRVPASGDDPLMTYPNVVTYDLDSANNELRRSYGAALDDDERIIATNISALRFEYLLDDGTTELGGTALTLAQREKIVAVRIFLTGQTENAKAGENKTRVLQTTVKIRNA